MNQPTSYKGKFYVYLLSDEAGTVYYVGKGSGTRYLQHEKDAINGIDTTATKAVQHIKALGSRVVSKIVFETDNEAEAYQEERRVADKYRSTLFNGKHVGGGGWKRTAIKSRPHWLPNELAAEARHFGCPITTQMVQEMCRSGAIAHKLIPNSRSKYTAYHIEDEEAQRWMTQWTSNP
jgi:hypothetical protein